MRMPCNELTGFVKYPTAVNLSRSQSIQEYGDDEEKKAERDSHGEFFWGSRLLLSCQNNPACMVCTTEYVL